MRLGKEIQALRDRALSDLAHFHDYYIHTGTAWRLLRELVNSGIEIEVPNVVTGTVADGPALAARAQSYVAEYLAESVFRRLVTIFEDFVFGMMGAWLRTYPRSLTKSVGADGGNHPSLIDIILDSSDKATMIAALVDRELNAGSVWGPTFLVQVLEQTCQPWASIGRSNPESD